MRDGSDFVGYGTPLEQVGDEESLRKLASENKLKASKVLDKQGRERFHGAFTGGYSAGYYNTVGTADGWTPSTFTSSKQKTGDRGTESSRPEDFMDEEDLDTFGIAPRQIQVKDGFKSRDESKQRAAWDPVVPGLSQTLTNMVKPANQSIAVKLLRLMGWKEGQGVGPRVKRKATRQRTLGPSLPPGHREEHSDSDDEYIDTNNITFAPKDLNPINFNVKDNLHGIGYEPLSIEPQSKSSSVEEERLTFGGFRKGISGQAFGVGIEEEDEDADIYKREKMSDYDMTLEDEPLELHKFTKPLEAARSTPMYQSGRVLAGFCLAKRMDKPHEEYTVPDIPTGYKPKAAITGPSQLPSLSGKLDSTLRSLIIGEPLQAVKSPLASEVSKPLLPGKKEELNLNDSKPRDNQQYDEEDTPLPPLRSTEPLNKQSVDFKPFSKNPEKQARYERYLTLKRAGDRDAYRKVAPAEFRMHEREREREEFERSGKFFKDLTGVMASRFTRSKLTDEEDDSKVSVRVDEEMDDFIDDKKKAVQMKMFGEMTRESYEWHPHRLMCKRFNVPDPYPESQLVGLPTVYKDKISAYNFLDIETLTTAPSELKEKKEAELAEKAKEDKSKEVSVSSLAPRSLPGGDKAPLDLFKAVFQDSGQSESSSDEADSEPEDKKQSTPPPDAKAKLQLLQEQYSKARDVADVYDQKPSTADEPVEAAPKVKFVPKKDRYKSAKKERKTRWSLPEESTPSTVPVDTNMSTGGQQPADGVGQSLPAGEKEQSSSKDTELSSQKDVDDQKESDTKNDTETKNDTDTQKEPDTEKEPNAEKKLDANKPLDVEEMCTEETTSEIVTSKDKQASESDEDCWMPELPPSMVGGSVAAATEKFDGGYPHKGHKHKSKHKKESKKRKKHHKEDRRR